MLTIRISTKLFSLPITRASQAEAWKQSLPGLSWLLHEDTWYLELQEHSGYSTLKETDAQHKSRFLARPALLYNIGTERFLQMSLTSKHFLNNQNNNNKVLGEYHEDVTQ